MQRAKVLVLTFIAALSLSAVASAVASAHEFVVEGKAVSGEEHLPYEGTSGTFKLESTVGGATAEVECTSGIKYTGSLEREGRSTNSDSMNSCTVVKPKKGCTIEPLVFNTGGQLITEAGAFRDEFTGVGTDETYPEFIGILAFLPMEKETCGFGGVSYRALHGHWSCELINPSGTTESIEHEVVCLRPSETHIRWGGALARFTLHENVKLTSGKKWSAH